MWAILAVLAKITNPELVGRFTLGLAVAAPIALLFNFNLRSLQATDVRREYGFRTYLHLRAVNAAMAFSVCATVAWLSDFAVATKIVIVWISLAKAFESLSDICYGLFQKHGVMDRVGQSLVVRGSLAFLTVAGCVLATGRLQPGVASMALAWLLVFVAMDLQRVRRIEPSSARPSRVEVWALQRKSIPLGVTMMLISLNTSIPIYVLGSFGGEFEVGIYAAINYVGVVGTTVVSALAQVAAPRLATFHAERDRRGFQGFLNRLVILGLCLGAAGVVAAVTVGAPLLTFLYSPEYASRSDLFLVLMVAHGFGYAISFTGAALTAQRRLRAMVFVNLLTVAINLAGCLAWVPTHGAMGAAYAVLTALLVKLVVNYVVAALQTTSRPELA
jgi:O-antigen/teichoic acid export membrane protein